MILHLYRNMEKNPPLQGIHLVQGLVKIVFLRLVVELPDKVLVSILVKVPDGGLIGQKGGISGGNHVGVDLAAHQNQPLLLLQLCKERTCQAGWSILSQLLIRFQFRVQMRFVLV